MTEAVRLVAPHLLGLDEFHDDRGRLTVAETRDLPFELRRVYWIAGVPPGAWRGGHAHRRVTELLVAAAGRFVVRCRSAEGVQEHELVGGGDALLVPPLVWREVREFSDGAVCLVLASEGHDPEEYVRDPDEFRALLDDT